MKSPRTTRPTSGDKYYIRQATGGYSTCIQGKPTDSQCNVLANCVGFSCGFYNEEHEFGYEKYHLNCNAENFIERAIASGLSVVKNPVVGGILVWQKGATLNSDDGCGHVAGCTWVNDANNPTQIKTSESGYGSSAFWTTTRNKGNGNWGAGSGYTYRGCIAPIGYVPPTTDPFPGVSDEELARRVWAGEFGNGDERRNKLGSRYDAVQALVNQGVGKPVEPTPTPTPIGERKGLDISSWQQGISFDAIKNSEYNKFVILRGGFTGWGTGVSYNKDSCFEGFYADAKARGIPVGCYWYSCANTYDKGVAEANFLYDNCLKGKQFEYPIYIDVEDSHWQVGNKDGVTAAIKGFCETLEAKKYYVGIYASDISGFQEKMYLDQLGAYDKWVARYGSKPQYVKSYGMWQTASDGRRIYKER